MENAAGTSELRIYSFGKEIHTFNFAFVYSISTGFLSS